MKRIAILLLATAASLVGIVNCGDDETMTTSTTSTTTSSTTTSSTTSGSGGGGGGGNPAAPPISPNIVDRMGRPAINTALNATFEADAAKKDMAKDAWNGSDATKWSGYQAEVEKNLAVLDALDAMCGNQILAGPNATAGRYAGLAGALVDDRLWIKADADTCSEYLAVEANATGILANMDCGGRALPYDVIDRSYSVLAIGMLGGVTDGVAKPANVDNKTFPYLANPN
jgi:hypothetical protein